MPRVLASGVARRLMSSWVSLALQVLSEGIISKVNIPLKNIHQALQLS